MALNKVINDANQKFEPVTTETLVFDTVPTVNSFNAITSDGVARAVAGASGEVPAVTESDNGKVLTAVYDEGGAAVEWAEAQGGSSYTAGDGISISSDTISAKVDGTTIGVNASGELEALGGGGTSYTAGAGIDISGSFNAISVKLGKGLAVSDELLVSDTWLSGSTSPAIGVTDNIKQGNTCKVYLNVAGAASKTSQDTFTITASAAQAGLPIRLAFGGNLGYGWHEIVSGYDLKAGLYGNVKTLVEGANSIDSLWYEAGMWTGGWGLFPNSTEYDLTQVGLKANGTTYAKLYAWDTTNNVAVGDPLVAVNAKVVISTDATAKINFDLAPSSGISFTSAGKLRVDKEIPWFDASTDAGKVLTVHADGYLYWATP